MIQELKDKKILVIVESPNKVAHIREYIKKAGYEHVNVMASVGHISNLQNAADSYHNTGVYPDQGFKLAYEVTEDKKEVVNNLKLCAKASDLVYLASDPDREGSQIAWSLITFLNLTKDKYRRMVTHEITPKAVVHAFEHPIELETNLIQAAQTRAAVDKMIGYTLSPIAKLHIGAKSVGRCQSVGLKLVVDRENEIENFKPETFYDLYLHFKKNNTKFKAKYVGTTNKKINKITNKTIIDKAKKDCQNNKFVITNITQKEKIEQPQPPFCTATLQQEAASKLGLKVKDIMSICQKLFEAGRISYHRTDDTTFSPEFIEILKPYVLANYKHYTEARKAKNSDAAQAGHECLRITNPELTPEQFNKLDQNAFNQKVYKLIWQRTIASVLPNAEYSTTTYEIKNGDHIFNFVSTELLKEGFKKVYSYSDDEKDNPCVKETFKINEILQECELADETKQTTPPARYTEATLIKTLQAKNIGRPSTYATIVETVLSTSRNYANLQDKKIVPTETGKQLVGFLDRSFSDLINLKYTSDLEANLDLIADGKLKSGIFLQNFYELLETNIKNSNKESVGKSDLPKCELCGGQMVLRRNKFAQLFLGCSNFPKCKNIISLKNKKAL